MNDSPTIIRTRELELRYKVHRLASPFTGTLRDSRNLMMLAEKLLDDAARDVLLVFHLTPRLRLLGFHRVEAQRNSEAIIAEVLRAALLSNAAMLVYLHRRTRGDWASGDDGPLVRDLRQAARMFDVELRDAVIIWSLPHELTFYSFRMNNEL